MGSAAPTRAAIAGAHCTTEELITDIRATLAELAAHSLDQSPVATHLNRALLELLKAKMQAGAFLDIA
jgi:hypothetical protein